MKKFYKHIFVLFLVLSPLLQAQNGVWKVIGNMPLPVNSAQAVVRDTLIYIIGGYSDSLHISVPVIQVYSPNTNTWLPTTMMLNYRRDSFSAFMYGDSVFIFGGQFPASPDSVRQSLEKWDFKKPPVVVAKNANFARSNCAGGVFKDKMVIFGGNPQLPHDTSFHQVVEYDLRSRQVSFRYDTSTPSSIPVQAAYGVVDSSLYILSGYQGSFLRTTVYQYDIFSHQIKKLTRKVLQARGGAATIVLPTKRMIVIGGYNDNFDPITTTEFYLFNNGDFTMTQGPELNFPRSNSMAVFYKNRVIVFGGYFYDNEFHEQSVSQVEALMVPDAVTGNENTAASQDFELENNYPNPFNPSTKISFSIANAGYYSMDIYSILGAKIKTITQGYLPKGKFSVSWDGKDESGNAAASGVYLYSLKSAGYMKTKKMLLIR
ncbi:MAG: T9SS type A sorting domain-containing protein [Ignavibacteria bacterium]|nr:T9SS type A sorting domain-containing protein [Ignavibacteria bacterium]